MASAETFGSEIAMKYNINRVSIIVVIATIGCASELFISIPEIGTPVWIDTDPACGLSS
jgi:hypothetical protein